MDQQVLNRIVDAVESIYSPRSTNETRKAAQAYCEQLKDDQMAPVYGRFLADWSRPQSGVIRHFGLSLLENSLRYKWQKYSEQERQLIRDCSVELAQQYANLPATQSCENYLVEKLVCVFSELTEREWPQRWPQLNDLLEQLFQIAPRGTEFVLEVLKNVTDDTTTFINPITAARKQDLWNAMLTIMLPVPSTPDSSLVPVEFYEICRVSAGDPGWLQRTFQLLCDSIQNPVAVHLSLRCVALIASCAEWIPITIVRDLKMVEKLLLVMARQKLQISITACSALISLVARKYSDWDQLCSTLLDPLLSNQYGMQIIRQSWLSAGGDPSNQPLADIDRHLEQEYPLLKQLSVLWAQLGIDHLCSKKTIESHSDFNNFIQMTLLMIKSPSMSIMTDQLHLWLAILKTERLSGEQSVQLAIETVFDVISTRLDRRLYNSNDDDDAPLSQRYSYADYSDSLTEDFAQFRSFIFTAIRSIVKLKPEFCVGRVMNALAQLTSVAGANDLNTARHAWEVQTSLVTAVITSLPEDYIGISSDCLTDPRIVNNRKCVRHLLETLMNSPTSDTIIMGRKLDAVGAFAGFLRFEAPELAFSLLQKLFELANYRSANEADLPAHRFSVETNSLRKKACISLIRLALGVPDLLMQIYDQIAAEVWRLFHDNLVTYVERSQLTEFLVCIIHNSKLPSSEQKLERYTPIFEQIASRVCSDKFCAQISSVNQLSEFLGLDVLDKAVSNRNLDETVLKRLEEQSANRAQVMHLVITYRACLMRTLKGIEKLPPEQRIRETETSPWARHFQAVLPSYLHLIRVLHSLWDSSVLPPSLSPILQLSTFERNFVLGRTVVTAESGSDHHQAGTSRQTVDDWLNIYRDWFQNLRCMLYQLLGQATVLTVNEYFYTPATAQLLLENVFGSVSTMSNMHWSHLLSLFIKDAITHCPEAYFDVFLGALLPDVISFVDSKLEVEWQNVVVKGLLEVNTGEPNVEMEMNSPVETSIVQLPDQSIGTAVSDELIYQQSVRDLTRKFCDIWVAVFLQLKAEPASDENAKPATLVSVQSSTAASTKLKPAPDFGQNNALAFYLLRNKNIARPLLIHWSHSLTWKDTKTTRHSIQMFQRILPLLVADGTAHAFVSQDLLFSALKALHDPYHKDIHDSLLSLITDIYVQLRLCGNSSVMATLRSLVPTLADNDSIQGFDQRIMSDQLPSAQQRKLMREVLKDMFGVSPSQWFNASKSSIGLAAVPSKLRLQRPPKTEPESLIDCEKTEDLGLLTMFKP